MTMIAGLGHWGRPDHVTVLEARSGRVAEEKAHCKK